jgi:hypothetical protein
MQLAIVLLAILGKPVVLLVSRYYLRQRVQARLSYMNPHQPACAGLGTMFPSLWRNRQVIMPAARDKSSQEQP